MLKVASDFYKDLFKKENPSGFSLQNIFFSASEKVSPAENGQKTRAGPKARPGGLN